MLKIDLLPAHFAIARTNKRLVVVGVVVLAICALLWLGFLRKVSADIAATDVEYATAHAEAENVRKIEADTTAKEAELKPIADKVSFIENADKIGGEFWDRFHKINRYIYAKAQIHSFSITPPGSVSFTCTVGDTTECARFVLNFIRCPYVNGISISGLPAGLSVQAAPGAGGAGGGAGPGGPGMPGGGPGGMPGMAGGPGGMPGGPPGMPGSGGPGAMPGGPPGMPGGPGGMPGGPPGMAGGPSGMPGASGGGGGATGGTLGKINLSVTCTLVEPISVPQPPGAAAPGGGGGMPGMMGGPGGMPGGPGGMPGGPGAGMPPGGGPPGAPKMGGKAGSKAAKEDDSGGGLKKGKGGGGDE